MKGKWKKWIHITYVTKLSCALLKEEQFPTASRSRRNHSDTYSSALNKYGGTLIHFEKNNTNIQISENRKGQTKAFKIVTR